MQLGIGKPTRAGFASVITTKPLQLNPPHGYGYTAFNGYCAAAATRTVIEERHQLLTQSAVSGTLATASVQLAPGAATVGLQEESIWDISQPTLHHLTTSWQYQSVPVVDLEYLYKATVTDPDVCKLQPANSVVTFKSRNKRKQQTFSEPAHSHTQDHDAEPRQSGSSATSSGSSSSSNISLSSSSSSSSSSQSNASRKEYVGDHVVAAERQQPGASTSYANDWSQSTALKSRTTRRRHQHHSAQSAWHTSSSHCLKRPKLPAKHHMQHRNQLAHARQRQPRQQNGHVAHRQQQQQQQQQQEQAVEQQQLGVWIDAVPAESVPMRTPKHTRVGDMLYATEQHNDMPGYLFKLQPSPFNSRLQQQHAGDLHAVQYISSTVTSSADVSNRHSSKIVSNGTAAASSQLTKDCVVVYLPDQACWTNVEYTLNGSNTVVASTARVSCPAGFLRVLHITLPMSVQQQQLPVQRHSQQKVGSKPGQQQLMWQGKQQPRQQLKLQLWPARKVKTSTPQQWAPASVCSPARHEHGQQQQAQPNTGNQKPVCQQQQQQQQQSRKQAVGKQAATCLTITAAGSYVLHKGKLQPIVRQPVLLICDLDTLIGSQGNARHDAALKHLSDVWTATRCVHECQLVVTTSRHWQAWQDVWRDRSHSMMVPDVVAAGNGTRIYQLRDKLWHEDTAWRAALTHAGWDRHAVEAIVNELMLQYPGDVRCGPHKHQSSHRVQIKVRPCQLADVLQSLRQQLEQCAAESALAQGLKCGSPVERKLDTVLHVHAERSWVLVDVLPRLASTASVLQYLTSGWVGSPDSVLVCERRTAGKHQLPSAFLEDTARWNGIPAVYVAVGASNAAKGPSMQWTQHSIAQQRHLGVSNSIDSNGGRSINGCSNGRGMLSSNSMLAADVYHSTAAVASAASSQPVGAGSITVRNPAPTACGNIHPTTVDLGSLSCAIMQRQSAPCTCGATSASQATLECTPKCCNVHHAPSGLHQQVQVVQDTYAEDLHLTHTAKVKQHQRHGKHDKQQQRQYPGLAKQLTVHKQASEGISQALQYLGLL
eukprot:jgi/Chrzof1/8347/Cz03g07030.t1